MEHLPSDFIQRMQNQLGPEAQDFFEALNESPPVSIRLNHHKGKSDFHEGERVLWCNEGYYLPSRPAFFLDPHWHGGAYYVQEASSMILDYILHQLALDNKARVWVDLCAAPGGKTGILAKHLGKSDVLIANEVVPQRKAVLRENLIKGGFLNVVITGEQSSSFNEPLADIILIDAPCAGEGMMRKEPEAIRQWSPNLVRECSILQNKISREAIHALKPGGYLIYSTCSYSHQENIEIVADILRSNPLESIAVEFPEKWNIAQIQLNGSVGYQLYPHKVKGEGLFIAVLQSHEEENTHFAKNKKLPMEFSSLPGWLGEQMKDPTFFKVRTTNEYNALTTIMAEEKMIEVLAKFPRAELIAEAGQLKGKDFIPSHFLAMTGIQHPSFQKIGTNIDISLDYLERGTSGITANVADGWYIIAHHNTSLGWAKKTRQGWKNHYPLNWRLRSRKK